MEDREKPSWGIIIFGPVLFITGSLAALLWFFYWLFEVFFGKLSELEVFYTGHFYMLGVGVGMLVLAIVTVQEFWLGKPLSNKQAAYLTKMALISVVLAFTAPHLIHYCADNYLLKRGYSVCEEASRQWRFFQHIVYIQPSIECSADLKDK
ncbi:hypothetical protein AGMMS50289_19160 [Betaproteobacteria bacterium]|nr:hypothetical protein AGMMS50289_19160 [Betaproteobacteria bacterium]